MSTEEWIAIEGFSKYEVSNLGRIRSNQKSQVKHGQTHVILRQYVNNQGFPWVCLYNEIGKKQRYVHRMVAHAFLGKPISGQQVNHLDFNRMNNCITNLEYVSSQENMAHMVKHRRHAFGERMGMSKLTEYKIRQIRFLRQFGMPVRKIAKHFNMDWSHIYRILRREFWSHV